MKFSEILTENVCRPFYYESESASTGSKIGGTPPNHSVSKFDGIGQKYFATIDFANGLSVSIFYSFDIYGENEERDIILYNNMPLHPSDLIHAIIHPSEGSSENSEYLVEVTCHKIKIGEKQRDVTGVDNSAPIAYSKIGGRPYADNVSLVGPTFDILLNSGFVQLIQFDTPNPTTCSFVNGFPWDPGWLHVFVKGTCFEDCDFAFVIQQ